MKTLIAIAGCGIFAIACSGSDNTPPFTLTIAPASAQVLTCETLQFAETGGGDGGVWSVATSGGGTVAQSGLYSAPDVVPASASATVEYSFDGGTATAAVVLATAHPAAEVAIALNGNLYAVPTKPFEKVFASSGTHVYAGVFGPGDPNNDGAPEEADFYASADSGKTFTGPTHYHTGDLACATIAVDPVDSSVVYLVYLAGHGDSTSNTGQTMRLAVSTDGAQTFPTEYVLADSSNSIATLICPDIVAPSADHVIVSGGLGGDGNPMWVATFASGSRGANIGPIGTEGVQLTNVSDPYFASSDTNASSATSCGIYVDGSAGSPRIVANANGGACLIYQHIDDPGCGALSDAVMIQCSQDSGATWSAPVTVTTGTVSNTIPTGALSPAGNLAVVYTTSAQSPGETVISISKDHGATFAAVGYPTASWQQFGNDGATGSDQALHWESDEILWMSGTVVDSGASPILVDKTCDFGATWSGAVNAGSFSATGIFGINGGVATGAWIPDSAQAGPALGLISLKP